MVAESARQCRILVAALLALVPATLAAVGGWVALPPGWPTPSAEAMLAVAALLSTGVGLFLSLMLQSRARAICALSDYAAYEERLSGEALYLEKRKTLIGAVSHKLRTPLTTLELNLEARGEDPALSDESRQRLERARRSVQKIAGFLDTQISDLCPGRIRVEFKSMEAGDVVGDVLARVTKLGLPRKLVPVYEDFDPKAIVRVDARLLTAALLQLLLPLQDAGAKGGAVELFIASCSDCVEFGFESARPFPPVFNEAADWNEQGAQVELSEDANDRLRLLRALIQALGGEIVATAFDDGASARVSISLPTGNSESWTARRTNNQG